MKAAPGFLTLVIAIGSLVFTDCFGQQSANRESLEQIGIQTFFTRYCLDCHGTEGADGDVAFEPILSKPISDHSIALERAVRQLRARRMPPMDADRPQESDYCEVVAALESALDRDAVFNADPGRTETFRRLNRTEYQNAIRDLLGLEIDAAAMLPQDEESFGFDNVTVGNLSATLLDRYITSAQKISRIAIGRVDRSPEGTTIRIRPDVTQESHVAGLPFGTRGGALVKHTFPRAGEYEIEIRLTRDRNEDVEGLRGKHELVLLLDRDQKQSFTVERPQDGVSFADVDKHLKTRVRTTAGLHDIGVTFIQQQTSLLETERQPFNSHFNFHRHPRLTPAVFQISITGPYDSDKTRELADESKESPSRKRIMSLDRSAFASEEEWVRANLKQLIRLAYRRPVSNLDLATPMKFFLQAREKSDFDAGLEMALSSILVNPNFLFRIEKDPPNLKPETAYVISDLELASRLSFFLWSSIPDEELLEIAESGKLSDPVVFETQVRRLLANPRSDSLVNNFASQWLYLRNLDSFSPDARQFPDFDENLRSAFRTESQLFFRGVMRDDRSVLDFLKSNYTFLNERLAKHYGILHVFGSQFRRIEFDGENGDRGGLLRQGSILTVTSYATRTSPVIRGNWVLENIMGIPSPPPPGNVAALEENTVDSTLPMRERLFQHRSDPACASCHRLMDPVGFSLENFDAIGRWRQMEGGKPIDNTGSLPDGSQFSGVDGLESKLLARPELFVGTFSEKLLTFALGRGVKPSDGPAIRRIVAAAKENDYRFSSLIIGVATSQPFKMRRSE